MKLVRFICSILIGSLPVLILLSPPAYGGSPFYLTVERSFSTTEKPEVRLDYTTTEKPMLLRVLRPKSLERFLDGQLQISRSYEEPVSELNPGHYFVNGLNMTESPLKAFRDMLDPKFRISLQGTTFNKAILNTTQGPLATPPEEIIHGPPFGFTLVRDHYVDLKYGGTAVKDLGWWFGDTGWQEDRYKIRKVVLEPLPDGVYLVQAMQGKIEGQCLMQVSSLSVQVKQSSEQLVVRVVNRDLDPVADASVSYRDGRGKWMELDRKTDQFGEVTFSNPEGMLDGKLVIKVETSDGRQALADTDFLPTVSRDDSVFIVTDRPIFKPGETFFYKGIVRALDKGELKAPPFAQRQAKITLIRFNGPPADLQAVAPVTLFGSFSGSFGLDETQTPGLYRLVAEIENKPYGGEFRVRDYVKPKFYLEIIDRSPTVVPGGRFSVKFRAKRYSGGAPQNVKYEVFLYRKKFEAPQWVVESGGGLDAGADYMGEIRSTSALTEPKRIFSSVEARLSDDEPNPTNTWDSAPEMDESGEASYEFDIPKIESADEQEWIYTMMVRAVDRSGSQAVLTENIFVTLSEAQPMVRFSKSTSRIGEKGLTVSILSSYPDGKPAPGAGGVIDILLEQAKKESSDFIKLPFMTDDKGFSRLSLPEPAQRGRLRAIATLDTLDGRAISHPAISQPATMIIGGHKGEAILDNADLELYTSSTILSPGEKANVLALLPANWGKAESGTIWETISGSRVHETKSSAFNGRSRWFEVEAKPEYGTGFYHTVSVPMAGGKYNEETLGFRIIPRNKRLDIAVSPEREETEPLKPFKIEFEVKDSEGGPSPDTELAVTVVDRAVYAVQQEIRPGIFDFFYPLPRLNLATFYSDEIQGYGYADILKKPNFKLGALKSQSKITKKSMRDTAGWFPHVVTDADGKASIMVDLPANVTEWLITAIAADKGGRVGEAKGKFRTLSDISVEVHSPQFLRQGEEVILHVESVNHLNRSVAVKSRLELSGDASVKVGDLEAEFTLEKKAAKLLPLVVEAKEGKGAATLKVALEAEDGVRVAGAEEFDLPLKSAAMRQVFHGTRVKDKLVAGLPDAAKIENLKVQVNSGLLGAALNAATILVSYPYGCTEQLVHTTVPNLVLMDLIRRAGITADKLGPLEEILTGAEKNAGLGIKKIIQNQKSDGGFGLWSSDSESSLPVTVTALYALKFAKELKVDGAARSFERGVDWLSEQVKEDDQDQDAAFGGYELSRFAEIGSYSQPWKQQIAYVEQLKEEEAPSIMNLIHGLKIFAGHKGKSWNRFNETFKDTATKEELFEKLKKALDQFNLKTDLESARGDTKFIHSLGFDFGIPYVVSSALGVLEDLDAISPELETRLEQILLSYMKNGYWISTFDSAQVIFNSRGLLSKEAAAFAVEQEEKTRRVIVRRKDGSELGELDRIPSGFLGTFADPGTSENLKEIRVEGIGATEVAYSSITADVPFESVKPKTDGIAVERKFTRITPAGSEMLEASKPLRKGDVVVSEVFVRREIITDPRSVQSRFIVVEDGIPSLAQGIEDDETYLADAGIQSKDDDYWASVKETQRYPERTVRIAEVLPGGEIKIFQAWRVAFTGRATIPPAHAFDMYDESVQGNVETQSVQAE